MFGNILFPVDFSARCAEAVTPVAAIARRFHSKITLLHAIGDYTNVFTPDAPSSFAWREWLIKDAEPQLASFGKPVLDEFVRERLVVDGEPAEVIKQHAAAHGTDLITLPTHGRGIFRRLLLGSVITKVLHDCECPVWTTAHCGLSAVGTAQVRTILCALELSEATRDQIFDDARKVACAWGAELRLVHAIPVPGAPLESLMNREFANFLADTATQQLAEMQKRFGTAYPASVETGDISTVVRDVATACRADLVIIGRGHLREHFGQLRTNANSIVRDSPCPVLSF
jgi:nucleotide-binding universal stress UspA family protein